MSSVLAGLKNHSSVFIDTACFIYLFEDEKKFGKITSDIFDFLSDKKKALITSVITVSEIMVKPFKLKKAIQIKLYGELFEQLPGLLVARFGYQTALKAARIRAEYGFSLPDSMQLAMAQREGAEVFITNDKQLKKFKDLKIICLSDFV